MLKIANHCAVYKTLAADLVHQVKNIDYKQDLLLRIEDDQLSLRLDLQGQKACYTHSFTTPRLLQRAQQRNQSLLKACGSRKKDIHHIVDLSAGWGRDSFMLASQGYQVTMIEHHPLIFHCVNYLLALARLNDEDAAIQRLQLIHADSLQWLRAKDVPVADCLYLDPMFPAHKSGARPGKELQILQALTENRSIDELFELALQAAARRVVVKRPLHAAALSTRKPDIVYREKTIRFDVYLC